MATATFAAGCFWGVEAKFRTLTGVVDVCVGYAGGSMDNPSYRDVCRGDTGHAESVQITFDANGISYEDLVRFFWNIHDPTSIDRQGMDIGSQYRSAIFFHDEKQKTIAERVKRELDKSNIFTDKIVTDITEYKNFFPAEEHHQRYLEKHGR